MLFRSKKCNEKLDSIAFIAIKKEINLIFFDKSVSKFSTKKLIDEKIIFNNVAKLKDIIIKNNIFLFFNNIFKNSKLDRNNLL